jgi:NADP-dependent 3-hydroxy acid dehydrogenase YdfG
MAMIVVTGASSGVGRVTAREVDECGGVALPLTVDVADADQVERAAAAVEAELGALDVWSTTRWWACSPRCARRRRTSSGA